MDTSTSLGGVPASGRRRRGLHRHRSDVARLLFNLVLLGALIGLAWLAPNGLRSIGADVLVLVDGLPRTLVGGLVGVVQLLALVVPVVVVGILIWRRLLVLLGILVAAASSAAAFMAVLSDQVEDTIPIDQIDFERFSSWVVGGQFPSSTYLCAATAVFVAGGPWLSKRWRRAGWIFLAATVAARVLTATEVPVRVGMLLTLGAAIGSLALVVIGAPRRRVDVRSVGAGLTGAGLKVGEIEPVPDDDIPSFSAVGTDGSPYSIKVLGRDERDSDLLIGIWRELTRRGLGDDVPAGSPGHIVDHEALALGLFHSAGVAVPTPIAVSRGDDEVAVLVTSRVEGRPLAGLDDDEITDALLDALWTEVATLQRRRMAHRRLNTDHLLVVDESVVLFDLRWADLGASDEVLGAEVAELLASLAARIGTGRAVASAVRALPADALARAVPLIQPAVLTAETRRAVKGDRSLLSTLRDRVAVAADIEEVALAPVSRISVKGAVSLVGSLVLGYYLLSLATNWSDIWTAFGDANAAYVLPIVVLTAGTYFTGALSLLGAVTTRLAYLRTTAMMFGQAFLNRFTPANAGGMAMRLRYLQLNGVETPVGAASIGLTSAASGIVQGIFIVVFFVWGGATDKLDDFRLPDVSSILIVVLALGLVLTAVLYSRWGRTIVRPWATGAIAKIKGSVAELAKSPTKVAQLFGGAALGKLFTIICFWLSVLAFGVDMDFARAGALYMVANTVGSAVPTPGGVGGIEAALTAALIGFGVDSATAAAIVLFFRTLTFWLPTVPGYGFLQYTQRKGIV